MINIKVRRVIIPWAGQGRVGVGARVEARDLMRKGSAGILSPPLALLIGMLPNAPLTSHSRMSGSR